MRSKPWSPRSTSMADWVPPARFCGGSCFSRRSKSAASAFQSRIANRLCRNSYRGGDERRQKTAGPERAAPNTKKVSKTKFGLKGKARGRREGGQKKAAH